MGAGISGLTAAWKLRDLDLLVLEGGEVGGNAKMNTWNGREFNTGSAYFIDGETWGGFMAEIGLTIQPLKEPADRWLLDGRWVPAPWSDASIAQQAPDLRKAMTDMKAALVQINESRHYPESDYADSTRKALKLDRVTFREWLKPYAHPVLQRFMDAYCYSALGASSDVVSAYGGLNFYTEVLSDLYTCDIGNLQIVRGLCDGIERAGAGRILSGCFVFRIEPKGDGAIVHYLRNGQPEAVEARKVVLAVPFYAAGQVLPDLASEQKKALALPTYDSYVTAALCFRKTVAWESYDSWASIPDCFEDYTTTGWTGGPQPDPDPGQLLSFFCPSRSPFVGRARLLSVTPQDWARPIIDAFANQYPGCTDHLDRVVMTRFGHALLINRPGMMTDWLPNLEKVHGPVHLCHSDGLGLPAVEGCLPEAFKTAAQIRHTWGR